MKETSGVTDRQIVDGVLIVGAGMSGLCLAVRFLKAGITDFRVIEKAPGPGGVWRYNSYPGSACDVMAHSYSFSFARNPDWSQPYAPRDEIMDYIENLYRKYDLYHKSEFDTEAIRYDYDDKTCQWTVVTRGGESLVAAVLVDATGVLHRPSIPSIDGAQDFQGHAFHSAEWDHTVDLQGKRVALVGTGASAVQILPEVAREASSVTVFQRTAQWVLPRKNKRFSPLQRTIFRRIPFVQSLRRYLNYWLHEVVVVAFFHPRLMCIFAAASRRFLRSQVHDNELREKLTPEYRPGCKRFLITSDYYPALQRPNVELVTTGIAKFTERGLQTADGHAHDVDAVVYCTGFRTDQRVAIDHVAGRDGALLSEEWCDGMRAHLGMAVAGLPNFFLMMGPNSGSGHQSILFAIEIQSRYIVKFVQLMRRRGWQEFEVKREIQESFNDFVDRRLSNSVWNRGGCSSWFLDESGSNRQIWPGWSVAYWWKIRRPRNKHFETAPAKTMRQYQAAPAETASA